MTASSPSDPDTAADDTARRILAHEVHDHIVRIQPRGGGERTLGTESTR